MRKGMSRHHLRRSAGQALVLVMVALPLFFSVCALVVDGTNLMVNKRQLQNASDAAALAAGQELGPAVAAAEACAGDAVCIAAVQATYEPNVAAEAGEYSDRNGGPSTIPQCADASAWNCYTWPYKGTFALVEVKLERPVTGFFASVAGVSNLFTAHARAVASTSPQLHEEVVPGFTDPGSTDPDVIIPGATQTTTDPDTVLGGGGVGFAMSRKCDAIQYTGAGAGGTPLGGFATNGGLNFQGSNPKKVTTLYYNKPGCPNDPSSPPSGTSACTSTAWGDASNSDNACVKTLVDLNVNNTLPINWPIPPPAPPTPLPAGTTWDPSIHYPGSCINLGSSSMSFTTTGRPPAIYCISGAGTTLTLPGLDLTSGDGYTFFALGGAKILVSGNPSRLKFYWPSACGPRPTTRASFTCFDRTITNYNPQTLLYATNETSDTRSGRCDRNAICLNGQNGELTGDVFAPKPDVFPPTPGPTQVGGTVYIAGGALSAGSGFFESWVLTIQGNTGSYVGTGLPIIIPGGTHTTTDPDTTVPGATHPGTTIDPTTNTTTVGTTVGLDE
jgi:Putative Flp pilus-assembly TadE/G-like